jgi:tripartite-type tricarboxylate transporter receptor subunit TctC
VQSWRHGSAPASKHLGRFLPGNPTVIAENMPGAGTLRAANHIYSVAPKDGTALGIVTDTIAVEQALRNPAVQFDARNFVWIGRVAASYAVHIIWHTSKVQSIEDAKRFAATVAGTGAGNVAETVPTLLNAVIGTKFKIIRGYPATRPPTRRCSPWSAARSRARPSTGRR